VFLSGEGSVVYDGYRESVASGAKGGEHAKMTQTVSPILEL